MASVAQGAVVAYIAVENALTVASRDPVHADLAAINKYLTGNALTLYDNAIKQMRAAGQAYRGTPADPRVKVQTVFSASSIFLSSCPLEDSSDPFIEYYVATGKPVPVIAHTPPPPYMETLPMRLVAGQWKLADVLQNVSKTCSA